MSDTKRITVSTSQPGVIAPVVRMTTFWTTLVGSVGISHFWFGGSFANDLLAVLLAVFWIIASACEKSGLVIEMTKPEIRAWVASGMPDDIKAWKSLR